MIHRTPAPRRPSSLGRSLSLLGVLVLVASSSLLLAGCPDDDRIVVPNRVLDRPLDVGLGCVQVDQSGRTSLTNLQGCGGSAASCSATDQNQLVGFVTNSEKNELALFRRCDQESALVDLDVQTPGYNFVPVGQLPSKLAVSDPACRVVTANAGSCDLSVVDGERLASFAFDQPLDVAPSSLVSTVIPRLSDGRPLGARPGDVVFVPPRLSLAAGGTGGDAADVCAPDAAASVYVTFPSCNLVAEVSLTTERILQSRKLVETSPGQFEMIDTGTNPTCEVVDCPAQVPDLPETDAGTSGASTSGDETDTEDGADGGDGEAPGSTRRGYVPVTLEFIELENGGSDTATGPDANLTYSALIVGGAGSDVLFEIAYTLDDIGDETGTWRSPQESPSLRLENAGGVQDITATPPMTIRTSTAGNEDFQFLYVVAGDGSTHVVSRAFRDDLLGVECDTQIDPATTDPSPCNELAPANRRPFADGPGIRPSIGTITGWTFQRVDAGEPNGSNFPFSEPGVVGIGVTSFGRVVFSVFDQFLDEPDQPNLPGAPAGGDPPPVVRISVPPHSLWPAENPYAQGAVTAWPRVDDAEPIRALPGAPGTLQALAPSLRRIDVTYAQPPEDVEQEEAAQPWNAFSSPPQNVDLLGGFTAESEALYSNDVVRAATRDYQAWTSQNWDLAWEGQLRSESSIGRLECDDPGWQNATCVPSDPEGSRLVETGATFCDDGVLAGDKVAILGCVTDDDCGLGQGCLLDPSAGTESSGICVSEQALENDLSRLLQVCRPFINDPCGPTVREYEVTRATQEELWLRPLPIGETSHVRRIVHPNAAAAASWPLDEEMNPRVPDNWDPRAFAGDLCPELPVRVDDTALAYPLVQAPGDDEDAVAADFSPTNVNIVEFSDRYTCRLPPAAPMEQTEPCLEDADCAPFVGSLEVPVCDVEGKCRGGCLESEGGFPDCLECERDEQCLGVSEDALCVDGRCRRPCEPGDPDCIQAPLPGPACFSELVRYSVRANDTFVLQGFPTPGVITDRVVEDPVTGECVEDPSVSPLLTSRLWLGEDLAQTQNDPLRGIPECPSGDTVGPGDPNPCLIQTRRDQDPNSLFHTFTLAGAQNPVPAVRFSNPYMSLVLDLASLQDLAVGPDAMCPNTRYPTEFGDFQRSRIPRGYRESFATLDGYVTFTEPVVVQSVPLTYPVAIVSGPTLGAAFIVDAGGRGGTTGIRGQVVRIRADQVTAGELGDQTFLVR